MEGKALHEHCYIQQRAAFASLEWFEITQSLIIHALWLYVLSSRWSSFVSAAFVYRLASLAVLVFLRRYLCLNFTNRWLIFNSLNKTNKWVLHGDGWTTGWQKLCGGTGQKQCFLGKKCTITWYILHILNLQICDYTQKLRICHKNCKYALDENFHSQFPPQRKAAKFCHPAQRRHSQKKNKKSSLRGRNAFCFLILSR